MRRNACFGVEPNIAAYRDDERLEDSCSKTRYLTRAMGFTRELPAG